MEGGLPSPPFWLPASAKFGTADREVHPPGKGLPHDADQTAFPGHGRDFLGQGAGVDEALFEIEAGEALVVLEAADGAHAQGADIDAVIHLPRICWSWCERQRRSRRMAALPRAVAALDL